MEITIKTNNGMELAGMFAGLLGGGQITAPAFSLPQDEEKRMKEKEELAKESDRIKDIIAVTGMSKSAFAATYGIPYDTIQKWTDGKRVPPEYVINLLERAATADKEVNQLKKKHDQDIIDVATGKKTVKFRGQADV